MEQYTFINELPKKTARAISLFQMFEKTALGYRPEGYYLAFSGGKDSVAIYGLAKDGWGKIHGPLPFDNRGPAGISPVYPKGISRGAGGKAGAYHVGADCKETDPAFEKGPLLL